MTEALQSHAEVITMPSQTATPPPLIACLNSSEDLVALLALLMENEGWRAVTHVTPTRLGAQPSIDFLSQAQPDVCIYAVSLPYEESWAIFEQVRAALPICAWVVTTTNKRALDALVGPTTSIEIWGKPFDIEEIVAAVRRALAARDQAGDTKERMAPDEGGATADGRVGTGTLEQPPVDAAAFPRDADKV